MTLCCMFLLSAIFFPVPLVLLLLRTYIFAKHKSTSQSRHSIAFFHPYCNDGGGGERVLWCAIRAVQKKFGDKFECVVYTGGTVPEADIIANVKKHFNIQLPHAIRFVRIKSRSLLEPSNYPRFTLLLQTLASLPVAIECALRFRPDIMIDSTGHACCLPVFWLLCGSWVACYVHYPTISTDMLQVVKDAQSAHNNNSAIAKSAWKTAAKLIYYQMFAKFYGLLGRASHVVMVNSSWTGAHIVSLWGGALTTARTHPINGKVVDVVFPPCDTSGLVALPLSPRHPKIISIGQFRPEKNHALQLQAFASLLKRHPSLMLSVRLVLIGSARHASDQSRIDELKTLAATLGISNHVEFCINAPYSVLQAHLATATAGLHTMWNEHFGICVVELMAAGVVPIAHNSGGPLKDIVRPVENKPTGFLATTVDEYADAMWEVLDMTPGQLLQLQSRARKQSQLFSEEHFEKRFLESLQPITSACLGKAT